MGIPTVTITMMPEVAERIGVPRALGVPFPFGHPCGHPNDDPEHRLVVRRTLDLLRSTTQPGTIEYLDAEWPNPEQDWHKRWQPREAAPIVKALRGGS